MPAKSEKQRKFMGVLFKNSKLRNEIGIPLNIVKKFMKKKKTYKT